MPSAFAQARFTEGRSGDAAGRMYYQIRGQGPPLLLLHAFGLSGKAWDPFVADFADDYTLIIPDLPGHGRSTVPLEPWRSRTVAAQVVALLDELEFEQVMAVGHSAGATTLLHIAISVPDRIGAMILVSQAHRLPVAAREAVRVYPDFEDLPDASQALLASYHAGGGDQFSRLIVQFRGLAENYIDYDVSPERLNRIKIPIMLIAGDRDPYYPMALITEFYQSLSSSELWIVPVQGHFPFWPEFGGDPGAAGKFTKRVSSFFQRANMR